MSKFPALRSDRNSPSRRSRSTLSLVDDGLLVVGALVVGFLVLKFIGLIVGTVFFFVKLAVVAALVFGALRFFLRRR